MESLLTSAFLNGVGVVGLVVLFAIALGRGWIVTSRENDITLKRLESEESKNKTLLDQNTALMEMARLGQDVFAALRRGAGEA